VGRFVGCAVVIRVGSEVGSIVGCSVGRLDGK
jgi:hypothetical protein